MYGQERDAIEQQIHITATCGNKALAGRERTRDLVGYVLLSLEINTRAVLWTMMTEWEDRQTKKDTGAGGLVRCIEGLQGSRVWLMSPMTGPDNGPY